MRIPTTLLPRTVLPRTVLPRTVLSSVLVVGLGLVAGPLVGHHAFSAEFDAEQPLQLKGTVVKAEWINPHTWFHIEVVEPPEYVGTWAIEGGTPNTLYRRGLSKKSLVPGTVIVVDGYRAKDGTLKANGRDLTLPDGRKLFVGSSGTGAPRDGRDKTEGGRR